MDVSDTIFPQLNSKKMFYARTEDGVEELPEHTPLLYASAAPSTSGYQPIGERRTWRKYIPAEMRVPRVQTVAGILLGLLLLGMVLMLVAEAIRESRQPDPFLIDFATSAPKPFTGLMAFQNQNMQNAWLEGEALVAYRKNLEKVLVQQGILPNKTSPSSLLQRFQRGAIDVQKMQDCAIIAEHMKRELGGCIDMAMLPDECQPDIPNNCNASYPYRAFNGSCNNLQHPDWGMVSTPFKRLLRPAYADSVSLPRVSATGEPLPNARYLSNELYTHHSKPKCNCTVLTLYFGLFVDHDIIRITSKTGHNGSPISCCHPKIIENPSYLHPECMAIGVPENDPFFTQFGVKCLDFVRSAPVPGECPGEREQVNIVSSFLDASGVYGSFNDKNKVLRYNKNGLMKVDWINDTEMLPAAHHISYSCGFPKKSQYCFRAGDMRVNEQVELTAIHTIFMREHNRVATILHSVKPQWDDERLFQESRKVVIAELQHAVYSEFLPLLLGQETIEKYRLVIDPKAGFTGYEPQTDPSMFNVFGAAAFRVGHSLIEGMLDLIGPGYASEQQIPLHTAFLNPHIFYEKGMDLLLRGLVKERAASVDSYITDEVRNRLFQPHNGRYGMDLASIGIQRGRDQGIPSYSKWRKFCNLSEVNNWDDLLDAMDSVHVERLRKVYDVVEDIDLEPAALSESHLPGALVGPTHACLIARQFEHTRYGDRFWFEAQNQAGSFTPVQLSEIYKTSMARLLCDNSDGMNTVQRWPIRVISEENPIMNCTDLPEVDLRKWRTS